MLLVVYDAQRGRVLLPPEGGRLKDFHAELFECLLDARLGLGTAFNVEGTVVASKVRTLLPTDEPRWLTVNLVADHHLDHARVGVGFHLGQPGITQVLKGFPIRDIKHQNHPLRTTVVAAGERAESLLACGIPNGKFDLGRRCGSAGVGSSCRGRFRIRASGSGKRVVAVRNVVWIGGSRGSIATAGNLEILDFEVDAYGSGSGSGDSGESEVASGIHGKYRWWQTFLLGRMRRR